MEHDHSKETDSPERETIRALEALPEVLDYAETDEMARLHAELVEAMLAGADTTERATRYRILAEAEVSALQGDTFTRANMGMLIHIALMRRDGGRHDAYVEDLEDALLSARQLDLDDVVLVLEAVLEDEPIS